MDPFKDKNFVFIVSAGRTGTKYFGKTLSSVIDDTFSIHQPDVFTPRDGLSAFLKAVRDFGFYQVFLGKILNRTGIRNLSQNYLSGKHSIEELQESLIAHRRKYYECIDKQLIIESNYAWYGCIPAIRKLYTNYKIVVVSRDPKSWATSIMNRSLLLGGSLFGGLDWVSRSGLGRLTPALINDKEYQQQWKEFSQFQKVCWTYKTQYEIILKETKNDVNCRVVKFEDLFDSEDRYHNLKNLLDFVTTFNDSKFSHSIPDNVLEKKVHASIKSDFPRPEDWGQDLTDQCRQICGKIAGELGYQS